jgi:phage shock protein C
VIAGVAGGIAAWVHVDPSLVRVAWVIAAIFSLGILVLVYVVMMIVVPLAPDGWSPQPQTRATPGGNAVPGWGQGTTASDPAPATSRPNSSQTAWDGQATRRSGRLVAGTVLVLVGMWLLVGQYVDIDWNLLWPLIVIGAGVVLIAAALRRRGR